MMMLSRDYYDQIRILDAKGREQMRVDFVAGKPSIVDESHLQDKSDRYYYLDAKDLSPNEIYISPLDLNIEKGVLEVPYKPMIRYVMAVYGSNEKVVGYVVINYLAQKLFDRLQVASKTMGGGLYLVNQDGFYLYGLPFDHLWGFQIPDHFQANLANDNPNLWSLLNTESTGMLSMHYSAKIFNSLNISETAKARIASLTGSSDQMTLSTPTQDRHLFLVNDLREAKWDEYSALLDQTFLLIALAAGFAIPILSFLFANMQETNYVLLRQLEIDATYDALTGVYNRRAGFQLVEQMVEKTKKSKIPLVISFIDINNLKRINDNYGHDAGDAYIMALIEILRKNVSESNPIIRLGGDEFLVLLPNYSYEQANELFIKADALLEKKGRLSESPVSWSFSFGVVIATAATTKDAEALVKEADELMYQQKQAYKAARNQIYTS
jgi:diguanylate cyclase (GGDEF)-like protein